MKCALVEYNDYHDEVLPSFVLLLNRLGITPDVYLAPAARKRDAFERTADIQYRLFSTDGLWARWRGVPHRNEPYDLVIVNSLEPRRWLQRASAWVWPTLGVVHNADLLLNDQGYRDFFQHRTRRPIVLGRHIGEHLRILGLDTGWLPFVHFGEPPVATERKGSTVVFGVPGNLEDDRRNHRSLLDAIEQLKSERLDFRVRMIGNSATPDGDRFRKELAMRGVEGLVSFEPQPTHRDYFCALADTDYLIPLVDTSSPTFLPYYEVKVASAMYMAIGLGIPLVAEDRLARTYGVETATWPYADGHLADAMRSAITAGHEMRGAMAAHLESVRLSLLDEGAASLSASIGNVTGRR